MFTFYQKIILAEYIKKKHVVLITLLLNQLLREKKLTNQIWYHASNGKGAIFLYKTSAKKRRGIFTCNPLSFLKAFVTCSLGIHRVGFVMICFGATDAFFSLTLGRLTKYTGRIPVFISGALIHLSVITMMLIWRPDHRLLWVFYVIAALLGYCDAVWQTQINGKNN